MVSEGLCRKLVGRAPAEAPLLTVLSLLQAKFLSQDQINGRLGLFSN